MTCAIDGQRGPAPRPRTAATQWLHLGAMTPLLLSVGLTLYCCMLGFEWDPTEVPDDHRPDAARSCP